MKEIRRFIVLGLGSFGSVLARRLSENGCRVTGVDESEKRIELLQNDLYEAMVGDVTDRATLEQLLMPTADGVFICLGENIERSILAGLHAKELGARHIYAKGVSADHGKILHRIGVERVIYPEADIARQTADQVTWPNVLEFLRIDSDYSIAELTVPTAFHGKSLQEAELRRRFNVFVVGIKDALKEKWELLPQADFKLFDEQMMLVIGKQSDLERLREF